MGEEEVIIPPQMKDFISIDFETANPKRVSACAMGFANVVNGEIVSSEEFLIKPVGGHAPFQTKIHGIREEDTKDKPEFVEMFPSIEEIFDSPIVAHSQFDKQVLNALSAHYDLGFKFDYYDSSALAKKRLPELRNHKLKTLVQHFNLTPFKHHNAKEDAKACARIYLCLQGIQIDAPPEEGVGKFYEFKGMVNGVLADGEVNYKEAFELLYWLEENEKVAKDNQELFYEIRVALEDGSLNKFEEKKLKSLLGRALTRAN